MRLSCCCLFVLVLKRLDDRHKMHLKSTFKRKIENMCNFTWSLITRLVLHLYLNFVSA